MPLRRPPPDEMTDPTTPATGTPSEHAGGTLGNGASGQGRGTGGAPRLRLEIREPFLRLITSMLAALDPAADGRAAAQEAAAAVARKNKGARRLVLLSVRALHFGKHKIAGTDETGIVARFQYRKPKKIVCQMSQGDALVKIDILWSNIRAMSACFDDARFDTLKIQVRCSCEQFRADPPTSGMHLQWQRCADIIPRTFLLQFEKGQLERGYGKMLYTEPSLLLLPVPPPGKEEEARPSHQAGHDGLNKRRRS